MAPARKLAANASASWLSAAVSFLDEGSCVPASAERAAHPDDILMARLATEANKPRLRRLEAGSRSERRRCEPAGQEVAGARSCRVPSINDAAAVAPARKSRRLRGRLTPAFQYFGATRMTSS